MFTSLISPPELTLHLVTPALHVLNALVTCFKPKASHTSEATAHHSPSFSTNLISWLHHFSIFIKSPPIYM
nr:MAG TPA: hypothetical protein [Caudoviricetes sp.]